MPEDDEPDNAEEQAQGGTEVASDNISLYIGALSKAFKEEGRVLVGLVVGESADGEVRYFIVPTINVKLKDLGRVLVNIGEILVYGVTLRRPQ